MTIPARTCAVGAALMLVGLVSADPAPAQGRDPRLAEAVLTKVMSARDGLKTDCGFDILAESPLGDLPCKSGSKTAVGAWDEALTQAGLPTAERESLAEGLGLTPAPDDDRAGLWRANPQDVARLIASLRLLAGG